MIPPALAPVVVLILELNPPDLVDLLIDKLLVTGSAKLRALEQPTAERFRVITRVSSNQKIRKEYGGGIVSELVCIPLLLPHHIVGVPADIRGFDSVTGKTGNPFVIALQAGQVFDKDVLCAGKERDGVVTSAAVARRLSAVLLRHHLLDGLEGRIHGRIAMGAREPLFDDLLVTSAPSARFRSI